MGSGYLTVIILFMPYIALLWDDADRPLMLVNRNVKGNDNHSNRSGMGVRPYLTGMGMEYMSERIVITIPHMHSSAVAALSRLNINFLICMLA